MIAVKIKRVYEDGTILYIHPKTKNIYLFEGENFINTYRVENFRDGKYVYETLLKKPCNVGFKDFIQSVDISDKVKQFVEG